MLITRFFSAIIAAPTVLFLIYSGGLYFKGLMVLISFLFSLECFRLFTQRDNKFEQIAFSTLLTLVLCSYYFGFIKEGESRSLIDFFHILPLMALSGLFYIWRKDCTITERHNAITGSWLTLFIVPFFMGCIFLTGESENGFWWLFLAMLLSFCNDIAAYFAGRLLGKRKWNSEISPKKTWEGYFGGVIASICISCLFGHYATDLIVRPFYHWLLLGLVSGFLLPNGDLMESVFKRQNELKDSGFFLPGHGGFYDRVDAFIWAVPLVYFFKA